MRYIKTFENLNTKGYELIDDNDNFIDDSDLIDLPQKEFDIISKKLVEYRPSFYISFQNYFGVNVLNCRCKDRYVQIDIYKKYDDWYLLTLYNDFGSYNYKCDQFDGLLNCIKDLRLKYTNYIK